MSLHWLPVPKRIEYKVLLLVFKALHNQAPGYIADMVELHSASRTLRSNHNFDLTVHRTRLKYGDRAFTNGAPKLWNTLPMDIKTAHSVVQFKKRLKTYLFREAYKT